VLFQGSIKRRCRHSGRRDVGSSGPDKYPRKLRCYMQVQERASMIGKGRFDNGRLANWLFGSSQRKEHQLRTTSLLVHYS